MPECDTLSRVAEPRETLWIVTTDPAVTAGELIGASRHMHRVHGLEATVDAAMLAAMTVSRLVTAGSDKGAIAEFTPSEFALEPLGGIEAATPALAAARDFIQGCVHSVGMNLADPFLQDQLSAIHDGPVGSGIYVFTLMSGGALNELDEVAWSEVYADFVVGS